MFLVVEKMQVGIAIKGHIPERDGIWMGFSFGNRIVKSGKIMDDLIEEV